MRLLGRIAISLSVVALVVATTGCRKADVVMAPPAATASVGVLPEMSVTPPEWEDTAAELAEVAGDDPTAPRCTGVRLELKTKKDPQQGRLVFVATVINGGTHPVTLVEPGDGSESGWRTPVITWKVTTPDGKLVPRQEYGRCGNMNAISENEIFTLAAGERRVLNEWLGEPAVAPGHYIVRLVYDNDPSRKERGLSLGETRRDVAARLRKSTPCKVESGPVIADLAGP